MCLRESLRKLPLSLYRVHIDMFKRGILDSNFSLRLRNTFSLAYRIPHDHGLMVSLGEGFYGLKLQQPQNPGDFTRSWSCWATCRHRNCGKFEFAKKT